MKSTRKLAFKDAFAVAAIVKKAGIRNEFAEIANKALKSEEKDIEKIGVNMFLALVENAVSAQDDICNLLASICGKTASEVENADMSEIVELAKDICEKNDIASFFRSASSCPTQ